jgi:aspartyl-tRNA(Asn)/glutamyl-tRNA(Gln) amidotransferase subunit B
MIKKEFPIKIGLEVHGYLNTKEKLFCMCKIPLNSDEPNSKVCPICTGHPGNKPMLANKQAINEVLKISLVLGCKINFKDKLVWQRKHYDWADLPKGYQDTISGAYSIPIGENGEFKGVRIRECHLEEDPAQWNPDTGKINYNRSGWPLIEIVTEPNFSSSEQVADWLKSLLHSLSYIKSIRKNAGIKADVNISTYGERVEIKNLNSIQNIQKAIDYEIARQLDDYEKGISQEQETFAYDASKGKTIKMRAKEQAEDYRFIPDPDLPVIILNEKEIKKIKREIPEMPEKKLEKLLKKYKIDSKNASILTKNLELVEFFEELAKQNINAKKYISWVTIELLRILNYNKKTLDEVDINPKHLAELIKAVDLGKITVLKAKQIMNDFVPKSFSPLGKVKKAFKIENKKEIENIINKIIKTNKKAVQDFKQGNKQALNFLMGEIMKTSQRRADFKVSLEILKQKLS